MLTPIGVCWLVVIGMVFLVVGSRIGVPRQAAERRRSNNGIDETQHDTNTRTHTTGTMEDKCVPVCCCSCVCVVVVLVSFGCFVIRRLSARLPARLPFHSYTDHTHHRSNRHTQLTWIRINVCFLPLLDVRPHPPCHRRLYSALPGCSAPGCSLLL